jgi:hypothetical protein
MYTASVSDQAQHQAARRFVVAALRRVRLAAAVALAEQNRAPDADVDRLAAKLREAELFEREARVAAGPAAPLAVISARLRLAPLDEAVLLTALALERDPLFAITASALAGEEPRLGLSSKMLAQVFRFVGDEALEISLDADHPLVRAGILESHGTGAPPDSLRPFRLAPRVVAFLEGRDAIDPLLRRIAEVVVPPVDLDPEHGREAAPLCERVLVSGEDLILCLEGSDGVGRRTLVARAAQLHGREVVTLDAARVSSDRARLSAELRALRRECWLRDAVPVIARLDALPLRDAARDEALGEIALALEGDGAVRGPAVITCTPGTELPPLRRRVLRARVDAPSAQTRARLWTAALGPALDGADPALRERLPEVVQLFQLTPGGIRRAAANVRLIGEGRPLTAADVRAGISAEIHERFSGLAMRVRTSQRWDDLILPQDTLDEVKAFAARATHTALVYDRWGFREKLQRGLGLAALFSGPPGTGKTMVAGLIAESLGLELYMVDLSQVVSKWVGETEKQLGKVFDAAQMGNVVLLFDEADALFAKRTDVKSSNDRYANLEVNYLLQRIEQFGGVAILTTNLEASVDPAFKRRLAADVRFYPPDEAERERLWRTVLPEGAPRADDLDYGRLANTYREMCGGHIRNAVLRAAFLAAGEGAPIDQRRLERAAVAEYRAMGKVV